MIVKRLLKNLHDISANLRITKNSRVSMKSSMSAATSISTCMQIKRIMVRDVGGLIEAALGRKPTLKKRVRYLETIKPGCTKGVSTLFVSPSKPRLLRHISKI